MCIDAKVIEKMKKQKGKSECLLWEFVKKYLAKSEDDERVSNVFAMAVYGMVIFLKVLKQWSILWNKLTTKSIQSQPSSLKPFVY